MLALLIAAAVAQPGRDPALLHRGAPPVAAVKEQEQEATLRRMLELGGAPSGQAEALARLAGLLRARGLALTIRSQAAADSGDEAAAARDRRGAADARAEAIARYRELLKKYPRAARLDEALFFLADTLQEAGRDPEAIAVARELTKRFPRSVWAPASHVFIGEHLFDGAKLDAALKEYRAAAEVPSDDVYPYALYKAAWCRFNQNAFGDAMKLFKRVVEVSEKSGEVNTVQLAREARRDYVLAYARIGKPESAKDEFAKKFGAENGLKMLEQYGKLLFDTGRDPEAQVVHRQLLAVHGEVPAAALDQTRLLVLAQRGGRRRDLLSESKRLVEIFQRVREGAPSRGMAVADERYEQARRLGEETLRNLAVEIHNEARKTRLEETWIAARALYAEYLSLFPDAADAYDLRFFYGELLYARGLKAESAEQYEAVVKQDLSAKTPGRWLQRAAWSAVLARKEAVRRWALRFLDDRRLTAHGAQLHDLRGVEEQSAYALADAVAPDPKKAEALLAFVQVHPRGQLADKALFGAAAALSRAGRIDEALVSRARVWKEQPRSPLVPRALLASASDLAAIGNLGDAATLLERYAAGYQRQLATARDRRAHSRGSRPSESAVYEESKAQVALHDAAVLREARGELRQAVADRALGLPPWKSPADPDEQRHAPAQLRPRVHEPARVARDMADLARSVKQTPGLQIAAWREAARPFGKAGEANNGQWSWTELER